MARCTDRVGGDCRSQRRRLVTGQGGGMNRRGNVPDRWLLLTVLGLCCFGLIMVYSSSIALGDVLYKNPNYYFERQILWLALGGIAGLFALGFDYHRLRGLAPLLAFVTLCMLLLVLVPHIGVMRNGARRWFGIGSFTLQPAEIAKVVAIIYLARWL